MTERQVKSITGNSAEIILRSTQDHYPGGNMEFDSSPELTEEEEKYFRARLEQKIQETTAG